MVKEFEPYKDLWVSASEFYKIQSAWYQNPITTIDENSIEPTFNDLLKIITKCVKQFAEVPGDNII